MSRSTPETDAFNSKWDSYSHPFEAIDLARKLERERDEANEELHKQLVQFDQLFDEAEKIRIERDEARTELEEYRSIAESIGAVKAVSEKENAFRERDEALVECLEQARLLGMGSEREAKLISERDEARNIAEKLSKQGLDIMDENRSLKRERDTALVDAQAYSKGTWQSLRDSQDEVLRLTFENREISQELDKARDTIMKIEEIFIDSEDMHDDWMKVGNIARTYLEK